MQNIRLVTFDVFGTLLDWQSYVEDAFPGSYDSFRSAMAERQEPGRAVFPYRNLLYGVGSEIALHGPRPSRAALTFFAEGLGYAKPFADGRVVQHLRNMTMVGAASNCDVRHLLDVQKSLATVFDVTIVAEDLKAYKPYAEAWDGIYDQVTGKLGFDRQSWLHVSAFADTDLSPAKERGIRTCYMARPGGSTLAEAQAVAPDFVVHNLWELANTIASINGQPVRYDVVATATSADAAQRYATWMREQHGPDLLQVRYCQRFEMLQTSPTKLKCEYIFTNRAALDEYVQNHAQELRRKAKEQFGDDVTYERSDSELIAGYGQRTRSDFPGPTRP